MQTSLKGIARKAKTDKCHRFGHLYTVLNEDFLLDTWHDVRKHAAVGVDRISAGEYAVNLKQNVSELVKRLKAKRYRAKLVRRHEIPKGGGKFRSLGIPATEDKLLQAAANRLLSAIYEADFLDCSYGYRPHRGAQLAARTLGDELHRGKYHYVVEADIKGFFDHIDHDLLLGMLRERIADEAFIRLIAKWLRAGILDSKGKRHHPLSGTPQGGVISPILANVYLHHVLDRWFEEEVKDMSQGKAYLCRYADDFVCLFEQASDAKAFYAALGPRLLAYGLSLAIEKSQILRFSRSDGIWKSRFDFLGFEYRWGRNRSGRLGIRRRTCRKNLRKAIANFTDWCRKHRHLKLRVLMRILNQKLRGYYQYYGVRGNFQSIAEFWLQASRLLYKWLNRRSQRRSYNWKSFNRMLKRHRLIKPFIAQSAQGMLALESYCRR